MIHSLYLVLLVVVISTNSANNFGVAVVASVENGDSTSDSEDQNQSYNYSDEDTCTDDERVHVSPSCAVVLVVTGSAVGGLTSWALTGPLLAVLGFTSVGVAKGSFAAWWQSLMPLVMTGSLFSTLQSIAMAGVGSSIVISSSIGGAATASQLRGMCEKIDAIDRESPEGKIISLLLKAEGKFEIFKEQVGPTFHAFKEQMVSNLRLLAPSEETQNLWRNDMKDLKDSFSATNIMT